MSESAGSGAGSFRLSHANTDAEIRACFSVMCALRPHLTDPDNFVQQVRRQEAQGYRLLVIWSGPQVVACAGYRVTEGLLRGRFLYIDDLVTAEPERSHGHGERLMRVLEEEAGAQDCRTIVLDCGLANSGAHRFYFRSGMRITALRFARDVL